MLLNRTHSLLGKRVGSWVVERRVSKNKWECICDCGNKRVVHIDSLWDADTLLCKTCRDNSFKGMVYGKWTVINRDYSRVGTKIYLYCKCECGVIRSVGRTQLMVGTSSGCRSCSAAKFERGEAAFNELYGIYKTNAESKNREWGLTREQFRLLTKSNCFYTGLPPSSIIKCNRGDYIYNGIDRVDNNIGYIISNCVPCNSKINKMKRTLPVSDFIELCSLVHNHLSPTNENILLPIYQALN